MSSLVTFQPQMHLLRDMFIDTVLENTLPVGEVAGLSTDNMDDLTIRYDVDMDHAYLVCAANINACVTDFIHCNASLIAGSNVRLEAPEIVLDGFGLIPMVIFAAESLIIKGEKLRIYDLTIRLFDGAMLEINAAKFILTGTLKVVVCKFKDDVYSEKVVLCTDSEHGLLDYLAE